MSENYYKEALEICTSKATDWQSIVIKIAAKHPSLVVKAYRETVDETWRDECKGLMLAGEKIQAIKLCRSLTGMNLKEAKEAVERLV